MRFALLAMVFVAAAVGACSSPSTTFGDVGSGGSTSTSASGGTSGSGAGSGVGGMGGSGSGAGGSGTSCQWSADANPCGDGFYCNATDCVTGTCEPLEKNDDVTREPVCGCDGVNYWNAKTAAAYGMAVSAAGECSQATTCTPNDATPCPSNRHFCAQLVGSLAACAVDPTIGGGVCWGMPETCPPTVSTPWRPCSTSTPNDPCAGECEAIKAKRKHFMDNTCPT